LAARLQVRLDAAYVKEELTLVVDGAARVHAPVAHVRLERRRRPQVERLRRLDVVVAVDENGRRALTGTAPLADHRGMSARILDRRLETGGLHACAQPLGRALHVGLVLAAR